VMQPLLKVLLLLLMGTFYHIGRKSPNPPPSRDERIIKGQAFEKVLGPWVTFFSRTSLLAYTIIECTTIVAFYYQTPYSSRIFSSLCPYPTPGLLSALSHISPLFLAGVSLTLSAVVLRIWCYRTLGQLFTFEITIKKTHTLVTSGPYAYVRHPGYTASLVLLSGAALACSGQGSYLNECQIMMTSARWVVSLWIAAVVFVGVSLVRRGKIEDDLLKTTFGESWDRYRDTVPYKFVPGVI